MVQFFIRLFILLITLSILSCGGNDSDNTFIDIRDGQSYQTTEINDLTWMTDNMNYGKNNLGWTHKDDPSYASTYGRLYDWWMISEVCPDGWRIPTQQEYLSLANSLSDEEMIVLPNTFNFIAGGLRQNNQGQYDDKTEYQLLELLGFFWSSTEFLQDRLDMNGEEISAHALFYNKDNNVVDVAPANKEQGFSVRCVQ